MTRVWRWASWVLPPIFCVALYWYGLKCWFRQDDFAWLQLTSEVHSWGDFWRTMFAPKAQGSIRPLSERAYFMALYSIFGLNALPFRICAFVTQVLNLTLLRAVGQRVTGSAAAGFWAAILWSANTALILPMTWSSPYSQILCGFFLLLAFYCLLRYVETDDRRWNIAQWVAFLLGFGALEINVVYPALAVAYTFLCARRYFRGTLYLFIPSVLFTIAHRMAASAVKAPTYQLHFDPTILGTFWQYLIWSRGIDYFAQRHAEWLWPASVALILIALAGFAVWQLKQGRREALFLAAWFVIVLSPVLPLSEHLTEYYVMLPLIGLAILGGWALASAWESGWRYPAVVILLVYLAPLPAIRAETKSRYQLSKKLERIVKGVEEARRLHPGQIVLLRDVPDEVFWNGLIDYPFRLIGVSDVYLAPESEGLLTPHPEYANLHEYVFPAAATLDGLKEGRIVVYSAAGERLKNITQAYGSLSHLSLRRETPRRVDVANDLLSYLLGKSWYPIEGDHRWMPKEATVRLGGPTATGQRLYLSGSCPPGQFEKGALPVRVAVDGKTVGTAQLQPGTDVFHLDFALPAELKGRESVEVALELDRTFVPAGEDRELGLVFGVFEIR